MNACDVCGLALWVHPGGKPCGTPSNPAAQPERTKIAGLIDVTTDEAWPTGVIAIYGDVDPDRYVDAPPSMGTEFVPPWMVIMDSSERGLW